MNPPGSFSFHFGVALNKVLRDLWRNKGRTALVVLSIAVGVMSVGMVLSSNLSLKYRLTESQLASQPSHAWLYLDGLIDLATVDSVAHLPGIAEAEGWADIDIRWKPRPDAEWEDGTLVAFEDYTSQRFDLLTLKTGEWPDSRSVAVEFNHVLPYNTGTIGDEVFFKINDRERAFPIVGTLRDPSKFKPPFNLTPAFYTTPETMERVTGIDGYNRLRFTVPVYDEAEVERVADDVEEHLKRQGVSVGYTELLHPEEHFLQPMMDGVGLVLQVMAVASLGLSVFLVVNTMNALVAQQIPQIGIMKTVGGMTRQIIALYLGGVTVYGLLSLALAVPIGALAAAYLTDWMLGLLNASANSFDFVVSVVLLQVAAGLLTPLIAAAWPVLQGVGTSVREALNSYGVGGDYGAHLVDRVLSGLRRLPRMPALALRNTFRRMGRVALTQLTLVLAGAVFMMVLSTQYSFNSTVDKIFKSFGYDVLIGFQNLQRIDEIEPLLRTQPNVKHVEMWIYSTSTASLPGNTDAAGDHEIFLRGIPRDTRFYAPELVAGRALHPDDDQALLLNQKLAGRMGVGVGDTILIDMGAQGDTEWTVVGLIFDLNGRDQDTAYMYRDVLGEQLGTVGRAAIAQIQLESSSLAAELAAERDLRAYLEDDLGMGVAFTDSAEKIRENASAQFSVLTTVLLIMTFLMAAVGAMGLSGILSINVLERRREIGVMRAVGASSFDVAFIFMAEGLLLGVLSWALAIPFSMLAGQYFVTAVGAAIEFPAVYSYYAAAVWFWLTTVVVLSLLASWLPARRATQISVRESLAYE